MADRVLFISWGENVHGREERGLEVFNETVGMYGRFQQEGRIESFDVVLLNPANGIEGYLAIHASAAQIADIKEDEDFRRGLLDASMIVQSLTVTDGYANEGIAEAMEMYREAIAKVPQHT